MPQNEICPQCGEPLPSDAPGGACPKCLMGIGLAGGSHATASFNSPAGQAFVAPTPEAIAEHFPQLEVLELLGQGGMGAVYKARQPNLDRLVAIKILPPQFSGMPGFADRFGREARALARLSHPNIVTVYDSGETDGLFFLIMEFIDGANLRELIQAGELSPTEAMAIVPQICEALQFAHSNGIVHRDIKPENILVDKNGRVRIADFGLAKLLANSPEDLTLTHTHQTMGTPRYMAPEQIEGAHQVDHRADIYSLGVVFYELLTGELPLGRFDPPSHKVQVDVRLDEVVLRTLEKSPDRRYQQASEIKTEVETIGRNPATPVAPAKSAKTKAATKSEPDDALMAEGRFLSRGPGIAFLVVAAASLILMLWPIVQKLNPFVNSQYASSISTVLIFVLIYGVITGVLGVQMLRRSWHLFTGIVAAALALPVPGIIANLFLDAEWSRRQDIFWPAFVVSMMGAPVAIWACAVLWRQSVRAAYRHDFRERVASAAKDSRGRVNSLPDPRRTVFPPAIGMMIVGVLTIVFPPIGAFIDLAEGNSYALVVAIVVVPVSLVVGGSIIVAGLLMKELRSYPFVLTLAIVSVVVFFITPALPVFIWVVWTLFRQNVREAFAEEAKRKRDTAQTQLSSDARRKATHRPQTFAADLIEAAESLKTPGMGLILSGVLVLLLSIPTAGVLIEVVGEELYGAGHNTPTYTLAGLQGLLSVALASLQITAGILMRKCRRRGLCIAGAIAAMLPVSLGWIITAPLGLWALVLLLQDDARDAFAAGVTIHPRQAAPAKQRILQDSPYYATGWLLGQIIQGLSSTSFVIALCLIGMATILLPWGSTFHEESDRSWYGKLQYGSDYATSQIIVGGFLCLLLFLVATSGMREIHKWRPLAIGCFATPLLALASMFYRLEGWLHSTEVTRASIEPQGGHLVAMGVAIALLVCAAMQLRNLTNSTSDSAY